MSDVTGGRFLVTGGAGFIGSHLVDALLDQGATRVVVVDNFFLGKDENLASAVAKHGDRLVVYRDDASDFHLMTEVVSRERPDVVLNLATKALGYSFLNPVGAFEVNTALALTCLELLRLGSYGRLIHLSSSEVYGTAQTVPMSEEHPLLAETTYAAGKAAADLAVGSYIRTYGLDVTTVRPFNNYGERQNDQAFAAVIPITVRRILAGLPPILAGDGEQTRDFIYVRDTVAAILRVIGLAGTKGQTLNLGSGRETPIREIVSTIARAMGYDGSFERAPARPADVRRHCADVRRAVALLGPVAPTTLEVGLQKTVAWYTRAERKA